MGGTPEKWRFLFAFWIAETLAAPELKIYMPLSKEV
jgi:hypothetical protein